MRSRSMTSRLSLVGRTLLSANTTDVSTVREIHHGFLRVTPTDQPIYIKSATYQGGLKDPQNLTTSDRNFDPVTMTWIPLTSIQTVQDHTLVYDAVTTVFGNFIVHGALMDRKA